MPGQPVTSAVVSGRRRRLTLRHAGYALFALCLAVSVWTQDVRAVMLFVLVLLLYLFIGVGEWRGRQDR